MAVQQMEIPNREHVLWPDEGITRGELAGYYAQVSGPLLAFARNRPISALRAPVDPARAFLQRDFPDAPQELPAIRRAEPRGRASRQLLLRGRSALTFLAGHDAVALYVEAVRAPELERPDLMIFDLDPLGVPFSAVKDAAWILREVLARRGLRAWVKTSGGRGLHLLVPIRPDLRHDAVRAAARALALEAAARHEKLLVLAARKPLRRGRVYLDVFCNAERASWSAPYSPREHPGAPVATPLAWEELQALDDPRALRLRTLPDRLARLGDPFAGLFDEPHELGPVAQALAMSAARSLRAG